MLLSNEYTVKMPKKYRKILYLSSAYSETFFFLGQKQLKQDCIAHVDIRGRILFQFTFDRPVETCGMLSDRQGIVLETRSNSITIFDLETYKFQRFQHQFMYEQADQSNILTFSETKLLCIEQKSRYGDHRFKLSYYYYPFQKNSINRPCSVYESKDEEWTVQYQTMKANNSSMIVWWKPLKDNGVHFFSFDLRDSTKGSLKQYRISLEKIFYSLGYSNFKYKMEIGTTHIWEIQKKVFLIILLVSIGSIEKKIYYTRFLKYDSNHNNIKEARFSFGQVQDYIINCYNLGRNSMFLSYNESQGHVNSSLVYYVDHASESIITQSNWECNNNVFHQFPGYQGGLICQSFHQLEEIQKFDMKIRKIMTPKEMYAYLMFEAYPKFDQDLVTDVLKILFICKNNQ